MKIFKNKINADGKIIGLEVAWRTYSGEVIYVRESATLIRDSDGNPQYYDGALEDITEKKKFELALLESDKQIRESNQTKDKFFSIIAHDLKNPIQALILITELLSSSFDKLSKTEILDSISNLNRSTQYLYNLLENLLH